MFALLLPLLLGLQSVSAQAAPAPPKLKNIRYCKRGYPIWVKTLKEVSARQKKWAAKVKTLGTKIASNKQRRMAYMKYAKAKRSMRRASGKFMKVASAEAKASNNTAGLKQIQKDRKMIKMLRKTVKRLKRGVKGAMRKSTKTKKELRAKEKRLDQLTAAAMMMNANIKKLQTKIRADMGKLVPKSWAKFQPKIDNFIAAKKTFYKMKRTWIANSQLKFYNKMVGRQTRRMKWCTLKK